MSAQRVDQNPEPLGNRAVGLKSISPDTSPTYVIHPGSVRSRTDGDVHYIGVVQLVRLYRLPRGARWVEAGKSLSWREPDNAVHLYPKASGDYTLPGTQP